MAEARDDIEARFSVRWPGFALDVNLRLPGRGVTALFGASGSGKTTLLRCVAGLHRAEAGFLRVHDQVWQDVNRWLPTHQRPLGYVFQEASLFAHLSVLGNLRYGMRRSTVHPAWRLEQAIALLGIEHLLERRPDRLSGGERSRVAIARALAVNPKILLLDEPLAAMDLRRKREILPYLERLREELDLPMLYVSHVPDEVARLADHLVVLDSGRALASGPIAETLSRIDLPLRLGEDAGAVLDAWVAEVDPTWHLAHLAFDGGSLWTRDAGVAVGKRVRVRVLARDVSLATERPRPSSIQNVFEGQVESMADDDHPGLILVRVRIGATRIVARLTKRAAADLGIVDGQKVWAQIKSVALLE